MIAAKVITYFFWRCFDLPFIVSKWLWEFASGTTSATKERPVPLSPNLRALYEATALTKMLAGTLQGVAKGASA